MYSSTHAKSIIIITRVQYEVRSSTSHSAGGGPCTCVSLRSRIINQSYDATLRILEHDDAGIRTVLWESHLLGQALRGGVSVFGRHGSVDVSLAESRNGVAHFVFGPAKDGRRGLPVAALVLHEGRNGGGGTVGAELERARLVLRHQFRQLPPHRLGGPVPDLPLLHPRLPVHFPTGVGRVLGLGRLWRKQLGCGGPSRPNQNIPSGRWRTRKGSLCGLKR